MTPLAQDLTSDQGKTPPENRKKTFTGKKRKKPDGQKQYMSCVQMNSVTVTTHSMNMKEGDQ